MKFSRPSPSLVVSVIALVVACAGSATAAGVLIKSSSQVKSGSLNGSDIKNRSINGVDIASNTIGTRQMKKNSVGSDQIRKSSVGSDKLSAALRNSLTGQGFTAVEASRRTGPTKTPAGQKVVATLSQLQPGTYLLMAKSTVGADSSDTGLLGELIKQNKTGDAECVLAAGGDQDHARDTVATPYSNAPSTINMQMTRTIDAPTDVTLTCSVSDFPWSAADSSIIAIRLTGSSRTDVSG